MTTYEKHILNLKKLKDDPSVDNNIFICPSFIGVPEKDYKNNGDVYMTNKIALYGVASFVRYDVYRKENSLITLNDLDDDKLPEESNKVDIVIAPNGGVNTTYVNNGGTYTSKCSSSTYTIKHNNISVKSCFITCVSVHSDVVDKNTVSWGNSYNYENHEVGRGGFSRGYINGNFYVATSITKNNDDKYTIFTSIKQNPWSSSNIDLSNTIMYITIYFTVVKGDGDGTELNTQQIELVHHTSADATAKDVEYDGKLVFSYKFNKDGNINIYTGKNIEISYPK